MDSACRNMPKSDLTCNMALQMLRLVWWTLNFIVPRIMVYMSHFSSTQCNVTVNHRSIASKDHMSHVNKTSVCAQAFNIVHNIYFNTSFVYSAADSVTLFPLICGYLGSTVLMKAVKPCRYPRCKGRFCTTAVRNWHLLFSLYNTLPQWFHQ